MEYAILVVIIIGALLTIQTYIKRGVQGRLKSSSDDIGDQFSPGNTNALKATKVHSSTTETFGMAAQGVSQSELNAPETTNTVDRSQIANVDQEYWGSK
ncbi:MAG: hypothetical protein HY591_01485 [Candidatus Omnitrophica bacterium]|nr:hypothetical protein [Candidatus Omnitrophota bacterium]